MVLIAWLFACGGAPAECGPAECADVCARAEPATPTPTAAPAAPAAGAMTAFEHGLLDPVVEDLRAGVRPWNEEGIGICRGKKECEQFVGATPGELPPGDYMVRAELRVPDVGPKGTWTVTFETDCTTIKTSANGESRDSRNYNRTYEVFYAGEEKGYRLQPLRSFESPSKGGRTECTWKLTAPHGDGDKVYSGSWSTPEA